MARPRGSRGWPVIGDTLTLFRNPYRYGQQHFARYGAISQARLMFKPAIMLLDAPGQQFVLKDTQQVWDTRAGYALIAPQLGDALLFTDGEIHAQLKKWMLPLFASHQMESYLAIINRVIAHRLATWRDGHPIRLLTEFSHITFTLGMALLLGLEPDDPHVPSLYAQWHTFAAGLAGASAFLQVAGPTAYGRALRMRRRLAEQIHAIVRQQRHNAQPNVIRFLAEAGMNDEQIVTQIIFLLHASHDTTSNTASWLFCEVLRHPEIGTRLRAEIHADAVTAPVTLADLHAKPLLDAAIKETLRLYPQVMTFFRAAKEDIPYADIVIPKGWLVHLNPAFVHRRPDYFADPHTFNPDRFLIVHEDERTPGAWVGFGGGPHGCLGEPLARWETKVLVTAIMRQFDLQLLPHQDLRQIYNVLSQPRSGVLVTVQRKQVP